MGMDGRKAGAAAAGGSASRRRLLLIEPGRALRDLLAGSTGAAGFDLFAARSMAEAVRPLDANAPDLILLDLDVPVDIRALCASNPGAPLVVVTAASTESRIVDALKAGASGCLLRADLSARLVPAIHEALDGGSPMSREVGRVVLDRARRQSSQIAAVRLDSVPPASAPAPEVVPQLGPRKREILEMLSRGLSYAEIARGLGISVNTVRTHVRDIYERLGACTKVEAVVTAMQRGLLPRA